MKYYLWVEKEENMDIIIYTCLLLYSLVSSISIAASNIFVAVAILVSIIRGVKKPLNFNMEKGILVAFGVFISSGLLSAIAGRDVLIGFKCVGAHIYRAAPFFLAYLFTYKNDQRKKLLLMMCISILIASLYAVFQGVQGARATAFASNAMVLAGYLVLMIPLLLVMFNWQENTNRQRVFIIIVATISLIALLFNQTRGAWLAVAVTFLICGLIMIRKVKFIYITQVLFMIIILLTIFSFNTKLFARIQSIGNMNQASYTERVLLWKSALNMFEDYPILGVGTGGFAQAYHNGYMSPKAKNPKLGHAHNNMLNILAEQGIIGLISYIYLFGYIMLLSYKNYRRRENSATWPLALLLVTLSFQLQGLTEYNFGNSEVVRMYWFITGLALGEFNRNDNSTINITE